MKFLVIGITDAPDPYLAPAVLDVIGRSRIFSGGRRHHAMVASLLPEGAQWIDITVPLDAVFAQYLAVGSQLPEPQPIVVFASGDPLFFGFANTLRRELPEAEIVVFPTFNSLQLLAHRLLLPYHDMHIVSLTGRPWPLFDRALITQEAKMGVLTDRTHTPAAIARRMLDYGYTDYVMHVGEHLGNPEKEHVTTLGLQEAAGREFELPNCLILVRREQDAAQRPPSDKTDGDACHARRFGLPDADFALLNGREKMITKMPIRLLALQALELPRKRCLWDIGFCTGSVSIEARLLFPHLHITAFEVRPECESIIQENMRRMGAPGIEIVMGDFTQVCCDGLTAPDAVFIGGHGGHLKEIMAKVLTRLAPDGCIVMNSVEGANVPGDSRRLFDEACQELGLRQEQPLHIQIDNYHPINILKCKR